MIFFFSSHTIPRMYAPPNVFPGFRCSRQCIEQAYSSPPGTVSLISFDLPVPGGHQIPQPPAEIIIQLDRCV